MITLHIILCLQIMIFSYSWSFFSIIYFNLLTSEIFHSPISLRLYDFIILKRIDGVKMKFRLMRIRNTFIASDIYQCIERATIKKLNEMKESRDSKSINFHPFRIWKIIHIKSICISWCWIELEFSFQFTKDSLLLLVEEFQFLIQIWHSSQLRIICHLAKTEKLRNSVYAKICIAYPQELNPSSLFWGL